MNNQKHSNALLIVGETSVHGLIKVFCGGFCVFLPTISPRAAVSKVVVSPRVTIISKLIMIAFHCLINKIKPSLDHYFILIEGKLVMV
jgi:hypothetical protein